MENCSVKHNRNGFKWTIREILQLQREYELLELSIHEISKIHKRSENAILIKIEDEQFTPSPY